MLNLDTQPSRRTAVKILAFGNYTSLLIDTVQGFLFVPLYLDKLGSNLYGFWLATGGIIAILGLFELGITTLSIQRISHAYGKLDLKSIGNYFFNGILLNTFLILLVCLLGYILSFFLIELLNIDLVFRDLIINSFLIALVAFGITLFNNMLEGTLIALQKPLFCKFTQIFSSLFSVVLLYYLLLNDYSLLALPIVLFVKAATNTIPNLIYLFLVFKANRISFFSFKKEVFFEYLKLSPSVFLSKLGGALVGNLEPVLLTIFLSPNVTVIYSITSKAGVLVKTILDRITGIIFPSLSHFYSSESNLKFKRFIIDFVNVILPIIVVLFTLFIIANKLFVGLWVGEENYMGDLISLFIVFAFVSSFLSNSVCYLLTITGDIKYPSKVFFIESLFRMFFLVLFLKYFHILGMLTAITLVCSLFLCKYLTIWNNYLKLSNYELKLFYFKIVKNQIPIILTGCVSFYLTRLFLSTAFLFIITSIFFTYNSYRIYKIYKKSSLV